MISIVLTGFKTKEQAEAFLTWYCNSGEQDAGEDFQCRFDEGKLDVTFMGTSGPSVWDGNQVTQALTMSGPED